MAIHTWSYFRYNSWINRYRNRWINILDIQIAIDTFPFFRDKKADGEKYIILKDNIFTPLSTIIITPSDSKSEEIPSLIFDPLGVHQTEPNHYEEAKKHFKKIKILKRFEYLEQMVNTYNGKLEIENEGITKIVSDYLEKDFDIYKDGSIPSKENIVLINNLIPALKLFWYRKMFDHIQEFVLDEKIGKKELRIKGALIIIVSDKDKEKEIRECIECLKHNKIINEKYDNIIEEMGEIMKESKELSSIIKRRLVDGYKK
jgi:hypothetical protein